MSGSPGPRRGKEGAIEKHIAGKWHIIALQEAIEYLKLDNLTNHFLRDSLWWMCRTVQQGHFSLEHQSYLCLLTRYQRPAAAGRQRRTIRMCASSGHLPCIIPEIAAQREILFHHDVFTHQQQLCQETWHWNKMDAYSPCCNAARTCGSGCTRLQWRFVAPPFRQ